VSLASKLSRAVRVGAANHGGRPLREARRYAIALRDSMAPTRSTYSQHGEDTHVRALLAGRDLSRAIYVDVGANHPTLISNTYGLYRDGVRGVVVEPNGDLVRLHRLIRPEDVQVAVGCGENAQLGRLAVMNAGVLSTFSTTESNGQGVQRYDYVPILPLDDVIEGAALEHDWVCVLSVDTEGFDLAVLKGAKKTLARTFAVCVETNSDRERDDVSRFLVSQDFDVESQLACNTFYVNRRDVSAR
jgi:FkbM family methyltransferase